MVVKDLRNSFNPYPKNGIKVEDKTQQNVVKNKNNKNKKDIKKQTKKELKTDFCIMPKSTKYSTTRTKKYNERHEVYFSRAYRTKSIKDGLIVFLTEEDHRGTYGVHGKNGNKINRYLKRTAQKAWISYYKKTKEDFIQRYGQNYL